MLYNAYNNIFIGINTDKFNGLYTFFNINYYNIQYNSYNLLILSNIILLYMITTPHKL
jgi:hypothetical protein